jgi:hypothetical protein
MIGGQFTLLEYLFFPVAVVIAVFDNLVMLLFLVLVIVGARQIWKSLY